MAFMRDPLYILMQDGYVDISDMDGATGMRIPQEIFDEIVMMRLCNMTEDEKTAATTRVLDTQFETGADGLRKLHGRTTVAERVQEALSKQS